jgi:hypothetical protein
MFGNTERCKYLHTIAEYLRQMSQLAMFFGMLCRFLQRAGGFFCAGENKKMAALRERSHMRIRTFSFSRVVYAPAPAARTIIGGRRVSAIRPKYNWYER